MRVAAAILAVVLGVGCESKPRRRRGDDPVYQNDQVGLRFLVPDGWRQFINAAIPPGPQTKERLVVGYRSLKSRGAAMEVTLADWEPGKDVAAALSEPSYGVTTWKAAGAGEPVPVGSLSGMRYRYTGQAGSSNLAKEIVVVKRGGRTFFFTTVAPANDTAARDAVRLAIAGVVWKDD